MCQHVCYRHTISAKKMDIQPNWGCKNNVPPLSRNLGQLVPPTLAVPAESDILAIIFIPDTEAIEIENVEKDVIIEFMDR
jgi:hypothetical protein